MKILSMCSFFLLTLYCYYLNRLIPPLNIPSKLGIDHANDDEVISDMEGTTQDATNGIETNLDEVS